MWSVQCLSRSVLSQDLETGCLKLAIVKLGHHIFKKTTIYSDHEQNRHNIHVQIAKGIILR